MLKVAIIGYGNLGKGVEKAIQVNQDMSLVGVFTRRDPGSVKTAGSPVYELARLAEFASEINVGILCGGSATDLPEQTPAVTQLINTVDSFDTHAKICQHFATVDAAAKEKEKVAIISTGWDPGLFSINRCYGESILPTGKTYTFWGKGVSQGHSDAIRRIEGVSDAIQYTIPNEELIAQLKAGEEVAATTRDKHFRQCFVVAKPEADLAKIRETIVKMPNYFAEYETSVEFISQEELQEKHAGMPHGGMVLQVGETSPTIKQTISYQLELDSNPEFTASVLVAYARACGRLAQEKQFGAYTVLDIAPKYLSAKRDEQLRKELL